MANVKPRPLDSRKRVPVTIKIRPVGVELFHAEEQTYMTKLTVAFRNFANASNKYIYIWKKKIQSWAEFPSHPQ
jgi:hypothetical protein